MDASTKLAAQERAKLQGVTLSEAVRRLLILWINEKIDFEALDRLSQLPTSEDLQELGEQFDRLRDMLTELDGGESIEL